eukprot:scaffold46375_cov17-Tisochrysis_lutea.AAC.1
MSFLVHVFRSKRSSTMRAFIARALNAPCFWPARGQRPQIHELLGYVFLEVRCSRRGAFTARAPETSWSLPVRGQRPHRFRYTSIDMHASACMRRKRSNPGKTIHHLLQICT